MRDAVRNRDGGRAGSSAQYAALPWRRRRGHTVEILLVTTRRTGRWIVPKGWPVSGCSPGECAAREAMEEAGVLGVVAAKPIGVFPYRKQRKSGEQVRCRVEVFRLRWRASCATGPKNPGAIRAGARPRTHFFEQAIRDCGG